jgi:hypothetical protein
LVAKVGSREPVGLRREKVDKRQDDDVDVGFLAVLIEGLLASCLALLRVCARQLVSDPYDCFSFFSSFFSSLFLFFF